MGNTYNGKKLFATLVPIFAFLLLAGLYFSDASVDAGSSLGDADVSISSDAGSGTQGTPQAQPPDLQKETVVVGASPQETICEPTAAIEWTAPAPGGSSSGGTGSSSSPPASKAEPPIRETPSNPDVAAAKDAPTTDSESKPAAEELVCLVKASGTGAANSMAVCAPAEEIADEEAYGADFEPDSLEPSLYGACYQCAENGMCDADNNGAINMDDVQRMKEYALGLNVTCGSGGDDSNCDFDHNGRVSVRDTLLLSRCLLFCSTMEISQPTAPNTMTCDTAEPVICPNDCLIQRPCGEGLDLCNWDVALPLGSPDVSSCSLQYNTYWELNTDATATCAFDGSQYLNHTLYISIDNDVINCTLNGDLIMDATMHEGCAPQDPRNGYQIPIEPIRGQNTLVCNVRDRGIQSFFDSCVVGEEPFTPACGAIESCQDCVGYGMCDANEDGTINQSDVTRIMEYLAGVPGTTCGYNGYSCYCDVNGSAGVTAYDATTVARCVAEKGPVEPIGTCQDCVGYGMCDANGDGTINQSDVQAIEDYAIGLSSACGYMGEAGYCDLNGIDGVTTDDAILLGSCLSPPNNCGNNIIDEGETCDGTNVTQGYTCSDDCMMETLAPACGNGIIEEGETCDGTNVTQGYTCSGNCTTEIPIPACGDTICNGDETSTTCPADCGPIPSPPSRGGSNNAGGTNVIFPRASPLAAPPPGQSTTPPAPTIRQPQTAPATVATQGGAGAASQGSQRQEIPIPTEQVPPESPVAAALFGNIGGVPMFVLFGLAALALFLLIFFAAMRKRKKK